MPKLHEPSGGGGKRNLKFFQKSRLVLIINCMTFIMMIRCAGVVAKDMMDEEENVNAIRKLTEEFDEV